MNFFKILLKLILKPATSNQGDHGFTSAKNGDVNELRIMIKSVVQYYSERSCQCAFPRFRQIVEINCSDTGNSFYVVETEAFITEVKDLFTTVDIPAFPENAKQIWTCKTCASTYEFGWCDLSISVDRSYLKLLKLNVTDIGAIPVTPVPLYIGPLGHSVPHKKFAKTSCNAMKTYLIS